MLAPSTIFYTSLFLESKSRNPLLETTCLSDMDPVYNYETHTKPTMESSPTKDFNLLADLWFE